MLRWFAWACGFAMLAQVACSGSRDPVSAPMMASNGIHAAAEATASPTSDRCFGGSPPTQIAQDPRPRDLFATGREVLWRSGQVLHRMDVAGGIASTLDASGLFFIEAADSREVFGTDHQLSLLAIDL